MLRYTWFDEFAPRTLLGCATALEQCWNEYIHQSTRNGAVVPCFSSFDGFRRYRFSSSFLIRATARHCSRAVADFGRHGGADRLDVRDA